MIGAVLAGGKSERMGRAKALLPMPEGRTLVARVAAIVGHVCSSVVISTSAMGPASSELALLGLRVIVDERPGQGPLGAIASVLAAIDEPRALVVACDMPLLTRALLERIVAIARANPDADVAVPSAAGNLHVLCAVYAKACLGAIRARLAAGRFAAHGLLDDVRVRVIDEAELGDSGALANVNTPDELARALAGRGGERP